MHTSDRLGSLICYDRRLDLEEGVGLIREAKERTQLKIFANMTHDQADMEGWAVLAKALEEAGADAIEANLICPNIGLSTKSIGGQDSLSGNEQGGAVHGQNPERVREIVRLIKDTVKIPVVAKLTPNVTDISGNRGGGQGGRRGRRLRSGRAVGAASGRYPRGREALLPAYERCVPREPWRTGL